MLRMAAEDGMQLWHTPDGEAYVSLPTGVHARVKDVPVANYLRKLWRSCTRSTPSPSLVKEAIEVLEGDALDGAEHRVFVRVAPFHDRSFVDLGHDIIEIDGDGWRVVPVEKAPRFYRPSGTGSMPRPVGGGSIDALWELVNVPPDQRRVLVTWMLCCLLRCGTIPILRIEAEPGAGKTTLVKILLELLDPRPGGVRSAPRKEEDLRAACRNKWVLAYDNLSYLPQPISDALCCIASGSGFASRRLFTDAEEVVVAARRPIVLASIASVLNSPDLADRCLPLMLNSVERRRRLESEIWERFREAAPGILGAVLDAASAALRARPQVPDHELELPRIADAAVLGEAVAWHFDWPRGAAVAEIHRQRGEAFARDASEHPLVVALRSWLPVGTTELEPADAFRLAHDEADKLGQARRFPVDAVQMSKQLGTMAPALAVVGIRFTRGKTAGSGSRRTWVFERAPEETVGGSIHASHASHASQGHGPSPAIEADRDACDACDASNAWPDMLVESLRAQGVAELRRADDGCLVGIGMRGGEVPVRSGDIDIADRLGLEGCVPVAKED